MKTRLYLAKKGRDQGGGGRERKKEKKERLYVLVLELSLKDVIPDCKNMIGSSGGGR